MEVETSPRGPLACMTGTILAAMVESFIILVIMAVINGLLWHFQIPPASAWPEIVLAVLLLTMIFAITGYGLGQKARDIRLIIGPTMIIAITLWIMSGGVTPVEAMSGAKYLSFLPTSAALKILARELVGLKSIAAETNLIILYAWALAVIIIAAVIALRPGIKR